MILGYVFSKRGVTRRWVEGGIKVRCSVAGTGRRRGMTRKGGVPIKKALVITIWNLNAISLWDVLKVQMSADTVGV